MSRIECGQMMDTCGAPTRQARHDEINQAIDLLNVKADMLGDLLREITGEKNPEGQGKLDATRYLSLAETLEQSAQRIIQVSERIHCLVNDIRNTLF